MNVLNVGSKRTESIDHNKNQETRTMKNFQSIGVPVGSKIFYTMGVNVRHELYIYSMGNVHMSYFKMNELT